MADRQGRQAGTIKTASAIDDIKAAVDALAADALELAGIVDAEGGSSGKVTHAHELIDAVDWSKVDWKAFTRNQTGSGHTA